MVTGDHGLTSRSIARLVGLGSEPPRVMEGRELASDVPLRGLLQNDIFARVTPAQKLKLVELYQSAGEVVAMTGDGINDAPALRKADIGIAMGRRGTDVAREAAAMVLLDDAFPTIVTAVREGRVIFGNIQRFVRYLLGCNLSEVAVVALAILVGLPLPLLPLQILFLNLVTDVFPAFGLAMCEGDDEVMRRPPRNPERPIVDPRDWISIVGHALAITAATLSAAEVARHWLDASEGMAVTTAFLTLALAQFWHAFNVDEEHKVHPGARALRSSYVWGALTLCIAIVLIAVYVPPLSHVLRLEQPPANVWLLILGASFLPLAGATLLRAAMASWRARTALWPSSSSSRPSTSDR